MTNTLDLVITENKNRVEYIEHLEPLGDLSKGNHVLKLAYNLKSSVKDTSFSRKKLNYRKGNYVQLSTELSQLAWNDLFLNKDIDEIYDTFLNVYHE
jgi:hypothetical protein